MYERGNEAILAQLSEGILELYRKISETKKKKGSISLLIPPAPQANQRLHVQLAMLVILSCDSAYGQRRHLRQNREEGFPQLTFLCCQFHFYPDPKEGIMSGFSGREVSRRGGLSNATANDAPFPALSSISISKVHLQITGH